VIPAPAKPRYRVAIIGGGPGGSACALTLAKLGVPDVLLIEAGDYAQFRIGESIPPEANHLLQTLGIAQDFLFEGHAPCYGSCSYWGSDKRGYNDTLMNPLGHGWHLERSRFNRFMAAQARLRGIELLTNARLASSSEAGGGFALQLTLGGTSQQRAASVHADFVVDASGTRAVFARQRGSRKVDMPPLVCLAMRFAPSGAGTGLTHLWQVQRHRIFPLAVGEHALVAAVGVHDVDLAILLEGLLVQRRLVAEAMLRTAPHDAAVRAPYRVAVAGFMIGAAEQAVPSGRIV
jgi:2-polyprenyl-6-methoxyphenol hydroxylase-like FAD-dependent oxidoreductase